MDRLTKMRAFRASLMARTASIAALSACVMFASAEAKEYKAWLDIPAQSLEAALKEFGVETDSQVLFAKDVVLGRTSVQVKGVFTPREALALLTRGTGLRIDQSAESVFLIKSATAAAASAPQITAQAQAPSAPVDAAQDETTNKDKKTDEESSVEKVTVTGTRIRGKAPAGANIITVDRKAIDESGAATVPGIIQTLPQNYGGSTNEALRLNSRVSPDIAFGASANLRGLGADATLTLVNGRRLAPAGAGDYVDISAIPLSAVQRIEILADGASATYGSDAVGGVVNFILRKDFDGAQTTLRYGNGTSGDPAEYQIGQLFGASWNGGNLLAAYEYYQRDALRAVDRDFAATSDLRRFGGNNFSSTQSSPGNIIFVGPTFVTLAIPSGQNGTTLQSTDLLAGVINYENQQEQLDLLPEQKRSSYFLTARQELFSGAEVFAEFMYSDRSALGRDQQLGTTLFVPETNAYRQLSGLFAGQGDIIMSYSLAQDLGPIVYDTDSSALNSVVGTSIDLSSDWKMEVYGQLARLQESGLTKNLPDRAKLDAAVASSNLSSAFNPFSDGSNTPADVLSGLVYSQAQANDSRLWSFNAKADGPFLALPAGEARLAVGADYRQEEFQRDASDVSATGVVTPIEGLPKPGSRDATAVFVEVYVPIVGEANRFTGAQLFDLSASVRYDSYEGAGESTNSKFGVRWSPMDDLFLRGTWGTSFKVPQFKQLLGGSGGTLAVAPGFLDPNATNGSTGVLIMSGGNPALQPEEATAWTVGMDIVPSWLDGLRVSATYFDVDYRNRIDTPPNILVAFQQEQNFPGIFIRNPTPAQVSAAIALLDSVGGSAGPDGVEVIFDERLKNLSSVVVSGLDLQASYATTTEFGEISLNMNASYLYGFKKDLGLGGSPFQLVDTVYNPTDLRVRGSVGWQSDGWNVVGTVNYVDDYRDTESTPNRIVASWTTLDLNVSYAFDAFGRSTERGDGTRLTLSVINVADEDPPFVNNFLGGGYDPGNSSVLGRFASITLTQNW